LDKLLQVTGREDVIEMMAPVPWRISPEVRKEGVQGGRALSQFGCLIEADLTRTLMIEMQLFEPLTIPAWLEQILAGE